MDILKKFEDPPKQVMKTFEICFDKEPTSYELECLQNESEIWRCNKALKAYPQKITTTKVGKFWAISFDVEEKDWLFWCGFISGRKWKLYTDCYNAELKLKDQRAAEYMVQI